MIEITITKYAAEEYDETAEFKTSETPVQLEEGGEYEPYKPKKVVYHQRTFEPKVIRKERTVRRELLKQQMADEDFDFTGVIAAINKLGVPTP